MIWRLFSVLHHDQCYPATHRLSLPGGRTPDDEIAKHTKEEKENERLLIERRKRREMLKEVRRLYAQRLGYSDRVYFVFHDSSLDDLTIKMPRSESEMLSVKGMGSKRFHNVGKPLLKVIEAYSRVEQELPRTDAQPTHPPTNTSRQVEPSRSDTFNENEDDVSNSDGEIVMGKIFSLAEIVNREFAEAEAMGCMITVDDE